MIASATTPKQRVLVSTLEKLADDAREQKFEPPAIVVIGESSRCARSCLAKPPKLKRIRRDAARPHHRRGPFRRRQDHRDAGDTGRAAAARRRRARGQGRTRLYRSGVPCRSDPSPSINLDSWAMSRPLLDAMAAQSATGADIFVIEGVMGLFDGTNGVAGQRGATADLAAHFKLPVLLVLDVSRQAQSAAAVVRGFAAHDPAVRIAGVILNRVASERHRTVVADAISALGVQILGAVPREAALALPERHLGLVQAGEHPDLTSLIERLAAIAERHLDLDGIMASAAPMTNQCRDR